MIEDEGREAVRAAEEYLKQERERQSGNNDSGPEHLQTEEARLLAETNRLGLKQKDIKRRIELDFMNGTADPHKLNDWLEVQRDRYQALAQLPRQYRDPAEFAALTKKYHDALHGNYQQKAIFCTEEADEYKQKAIIALKRTDEDRRQTKIIGVFGTQEAEEGYHQMTSEERIADMRRTERATAARLLRESALFTNMASACANAFDEERPETAA